MTKVNGDNKLKWILVGLVIGIAISIVTSIVMNYFLPPGTIIFEPPSKCFTKEKVTQLFTGKLESIETESRAEGKDIVCKLEGEPAYSNHIWYGVATCSWSVGSQTQGFYILPRWHPRIHLILLDDVGWVQCDNTVYYYIERAK
jgi:hypothetical protein